MGAFFLKSKKRINEPHGVTNFDLHTAIIPLKGAGGVSFENTLKDFEYLLTEKFFDPQFQDEVSIEVDEKYYLVAIKINDAALQIQFDVFSGKINYISCGDGYKGSLYDKMRVGSKAKGNFLVKTTLDLIWIYIGSVVILLMA